MMHPINNQVVKNIFYDSSGRVKAEQNPYFDSFSTSLATPSTTEKNATYIYDPLSRVSRVDNPDGTNKTVNFDHWTVTAYDENGHRKAYVLDAYDRITNVLEYNNDPVLGFNYESDVYNTTYHYDTADNLIRIVDALGNVFNFTYDSLGRRIQLTDPDIGTWTYTYDTAGNLIKQEQNGGGNLVTGDGYYREYDGLNQLVRIKNGSTATSPVLEDYTYDPSGQRVKIKRNDTANTTIYTPFKELMRIVNSTGAYDYTYIYQDSVLVARINPDGSKYFYHSDHLGSTTLITNENGAVVEQTFYSPYGEIVGGGTADVKLYTGQFSDATGQYYYGARYYKPSTGQFIQPDPLSWDDKRLLEQGYSLIKFVSNPQRLNKYSYVLSNPYKYSDPRGLINYQGLFFSMLDLSSGVINAVEGGELIIGSPAIGPAAPVTIVGGCYLITYGAGTSFISGKNIFHSLNDQPLEPSGFGEQVGSILGGEEGSKWGSGIDILTDIGSLYGDIGKIYNLRKTATTTSIFLKFATVIDTYSFGKDIYSYFTQMNKPLEETKQPTSQTSSKKGSSVSSENSYTVCTDRGCYTITPIT